MTKPNIATIFRKRQVLTAKQLTKSLGEYGSQGGVVPFDDNAQQDTSFDLPLGTKTSSFGNAYFKGFNLYTTVEVQALVSSGKLTAMDRFVFWNLDTNTLNAWNGSEIVSLAGGSNSMDYLFGDGSDGDVTMVSDGSYDVMKNFENFTLNSGITLSKTTAGSPLVIRCTGTCTINGTINLSGKGFPGGATTTGNGYGNTAVGSHSIGGVGNTNRQGGGAIDLNSIGVAAASLNFDQIPFCGGGGGGALLSGTSTMGTLTNNGGIGAGAGGNGCAYLYNNSSSSRTASSTGGNGGGGLLIIARKIIIAGTLTLTGTNGSAQTDSGGASTSIWRTYAYGGGGGGGCAVLVGNEISITGSINCAAGNRGGTNSGADTAQNGGTGGYIKLVI